MSVSLQISKRNQWQILTLSGRVDAFSDKRIETHLRQAAAGSFAHVALDLSGCQFLSLFVVKSVLNLSRELRGRGGRLILFRPSEDIQRTLQAFLSREVEVHWSWEPLDIESFYKFGLSLEGPAPQEPVVPISAILAAPESMKTGALI